MKRLILIAVFVLTTGTLAAQNYIIVNSEKVFKSIDAYNTALSTLDKLAEQYQDMVDAKFAEVETLYNNYMNQKSSLDPGKRHTGQRKSGTGVSGNPLRQRRHTDEKANRNDRADPETGFFRDRSLCQTGGCRRGARFGQQPDAALLEPQCGSYAAGYRRPQKIESSKH